MQVNRLAWMRLEGGGGPDARGGLVLETHADKFTQSAHA